MAVTVAAAVFGGGYVGWLAEQFVDDVTVGGIGRGHGHLGDQLVVGIDAQVRFVPIEGPGPGLVTVAGLDVDSGDQPIPGHPPGDPKHPVLTGLDILAGHQPQQLGGLG
ncbi:hypothetical protein BH09ACT8_BH09ACT8_49690 [soil metagenome]